jgi:hypothetical protein
MVLLLFGLFRASFEPLSWRRDNEPSLRIEGRSFFLGGITLRRGSKPARIGLAKEPNLGRAEFFALPFPGSCTVSPVRPLPIRQHVRPRPFAQRKLHWSGS